MPGWFEGFMTGAATCGGGFCTGHYVWSHVRHMEPPHYRPMRTQAAWYTAQLATVYSLALVGAVVAGCGTNAVVKTVVKTARPAGP
jgi:hypothetical protein